VFILQLGGFLNAPKRSNSLPKKNYFSSKLWFYLALLKRNFQLCASAFKPELHRSRTYRPNAGGEISAFRPNSTQLCILCANMLSIIAPHQIERYDVAYRIVLDFQRLGSITRLPMH
jgi:hypothetical protein